MFPHGAKEINNSDEEKEIVEMEEAEPDNEELSEIDYSSENQFEVLEDAEELIDRSNAFYQSAMSITVAVCDGDTIGALISAGIYSKTTETNSESGKITTKYYRRPLEWKNDESFELPDRTEPLKRYPVGDTGLQVDITMRYRKEGFSIYTFTIENTKMMEGNQIHDEDCFFQAKMRITSKNGFHFLPEGQRINSDEDYMSNMLLYRDVKNYAIGHGCAAEWDEANDSVNWIETAVFPSYEVKPIVPSVIQGVTLSMVDMSCEDKFGDVITQLELLCKKYSNWIKSC